MSGLKEGRARPQADQNRRGGGGWDRRLHTLPGFLKGWGGG